MTILTGDERSAWESLGTGQVSDAMEQLELRRSVITGMRYIAPGGRTTAGLARTVRQIPKHVPSTKGERLVRHGEMASELAGEGDYIVIDVGGRLDVASWGENHSLRCLAGGVSGLLINGCIRDVAAIRRLGFPVACLGFSPIKGQWDLETAGIDGPIAIADVAIHRGDLVVGDEDGIVIVPGGLRSRVLERATAIRQQEAAGRHPGSERTARGPDRLSDG